MITHTHKVGQYGHAVCVSYTELVPSHSALGDGVIAEAFSSP